MIKKLIRRLLGQDPNTSPDDRKAGALAAALPKTPTVPTVVSADIHHIDPGLISRNAVRVTDTLQQAGFRAFIVGGAVRDLLLGVAPKDFDVATDATPEEVQKLFRRARIIGRRFQIVHVQFGQEIIETSTFRALVDQPGGDGENEGKGSPEARAAAKAVVKTQTEAPRRLKRADLDRRTHAVDASGRVLRDNVWGEQHEDATRRDFTINAMYYDPATQTVLDYHDGMADIRARTLRMIGDPATRFREDPVRMLRVVRFAAKLGFEIDPATRAPITRLADLINNVPAARLFDEMLKLLLSGHALACLQRLRAEGLHHGLLPLLDVVLEQPHGEKFVTLALTSTDDRVRANKPVSPGFLFAALLWQQVQDRWQKHTANGDYPIPGLHRAMDEVLDTQTEKLAIQKRFVADMKEIWSMQPRLEKHSGRTAFKLLEHPRFRAAYDFLVLRCESGELDAEVGQWWTDFVDGDIGARDALLTQGSAKERGPRRRRRRGGRKAGGEEGGQAGDSTDHDGGEGGNGHAGAERDYHHENGGGYKGD
ncbi:polynucleotide adenylyltransferase PcnB [Pararobbsia alpina]|uniref:Poly(A) polymerase I n=1 Tax=Pararobbsia alpina TaxID=621374 RepID=A0A6S7CCF4_9BURK|nr:polynucleotide adenylyltransferase PcnB [Pararobbsia alpina]CAB3776978.1 Poly(A) polymerase I [Pararobbsia alpina]